MTIRSFICLVDAAIELESAYAESGDEDIKEHIDRFYEFLLSKTEGLILVDNDFPWIAKTDQVLYYIKQFTDSEYDLLDYLWHQFKDDYEEINEEQKELILELNMDIIYINNNRIDSSNEQIQELLYK